MEWYQNLLTQFLSLLEECERDCRFDGPHCKHNICNCKISLVHALLRVAFGHHNLRTLPQQTSFCGDFSSKEFM